MGREIHDKGAPQQNNADRVREEREQRAEENRDENDEAGRI